MCTRGPTSLLTDAPEVTLDPLGQSTLGHCPGRSPKDRPEGIGAGRRQLPPVSVQEGDHRHEGHALVAIDISMVARKTEGKCGRESVAD